jgi:hypothetical protein
VAKVVVPSHEFGLVVNGAEVEVLILFQLRGEVKGKRSHLRHLHCVLL